MSVLEGIVVAIFCIVVVFTVLACLYLLMKLFSLGIKVIDINGKKSTE